MQIGLYLVWFMVFNTTFNNIVGDIVTTWLNGGGKHTQIIRTDPWNSRPAMGMHLDMITL